MSQAYSPLAVWPWASLGAAQPAQGGREGPSLALLVLSLWSEALGEPRQAFSGGPGSSHDLVVISGKLCPPRASGPGPLHRSPENCRLFCVNKTQPGA